MYADGQPYNDPAQPGRKDECGFEWWVCDPYPTWFRYQNGILRHRQAGSAVRWASDQTSHVNDANTRFDFEKTRLSREGK